MDIKCNKHIVSIPRSGQHMNELCLREYHRLMNIDYAYCEHYSCCNSRPCKINANAFMKDHDFYLNTQINKEDKYLFLYRTNITRLLEAEYRLKVYQGILDNDIESIKKSKLMSKEEPVGYGNPPSDFKIDYKDKEVQKGFENALINRSFGSRDTHVYYFKMYDKWLNSEQENVLPINYSYYTNNFVETFTKILSFFEIPINIEIIKEVSKLVHKEYDYYDDEDGEILYKIIKDNIKT